MLLKMSQEEMRLKAAFLKQRQSLPLNAKVCLSKKRIKAADIRFEGMIYVSISGGVDSTVLLDIARQVNPNIPAVFVDTGLEYPENRNLVKSIDNVVWLRPKKKFKEVISEYGYPIVSKEISEKIYTLKNTCSEKRRKTLLFGNDKGNGAVPERWKYLEFSPFKISHKCCYYLKIQPIMDYNEKTGRIPLIGVMASDSWRRRSQYLLHGCNMFDNKHPKSQPLAFWGKNDIWEYIRQHKLQYSQAYDMGYDRTGCMFCAFGLHMEKSDLFTDNRFELMRKTHPKQYHYCMETLGMDNVLSYMKVNH